MLQTKIFLSLLSFSLLSFSFFLLAGGLTKMFLQKMRRKMKGNVKRDKQNWSGNLRQTELLIIDQGFLFSLFQRKV